ncbi:MAG TPA: BMP family ABC transporter substrate-binding protein [Candidatus Lachnoclostridium stercorigallinarum]|uniref:BMP family ABC transporter substrate-binding protein n=1 Tax=Candidatus Lachnoclostridium stercorigallinarum TaxID=2838634 RepID=A0A9D2GIW4_9FIRM|nr:BMP family ABC transporter substrate-binding protein [Candidatus Lachnoclostridium stercorigallinarum]
MRKLTAALLAMSMTAGLLAGCGAPEPEATTAAETEAAEETTAEAGADASEAAEAVNPEDYRVGLMIPGNLGDKSFFDAAFNSIEPIKEQLGVTVEYVECGTDTSKFYPALVDMCEADYDLILTISSNNDDALVQVAEEYPDQKFINLDDELTDPPANVYIMGTKNNEMSFLAGAAGALKAAELGEDTIGFVGGMDIPGINEFLVGYIEGAQAINPDIKVATSYVGSFTDTAKAKENALLLYNSGLSVIFAAAGQSGLGVIDAAVEQGKFVIGVDSDQAEALKDSQPDMAAVIITSAIKNISDNAVKAVDRAMKGEIPYGTREVFGLADGAVGIAENEFYEQLLSEEARAQIEELKQQVIAGEVEMTPTEGITTEKINEIREAVRP